MTLITIPQAARQLSVHPCTIYRHLQAREYTSRILAGEIYESDVPEALRCYLNSDFPAAVRVSERRTRLDQSALDKWVSRG